MLFLGFLYLTILNAFDGVVTFIGLNQKKIEEANPFMSYMYELDPLLFLSIKMSLSILLLLLIYKMKKPKTKLIQNLVILSSILYTVVCIQHLYWLSLV